MTSVNIRLARDTLLLQNPKEKNYRRLTETSLRYITDLQTQVLVPTLQFMYLHSAELNVVAVTENVNTFLLVWTHVSRYGANWFYCHQCNVFVSALQLSTFIFISYFIHLSIDFLPLTPRGCATASVGEYVPNFFPLGFWVFASGGARE